MARPYERGVVMRKATILPLAAGVLLGFGAVGCGHEPSATVNPPAPDGGSRNIPEVPPEPAPTEPAPTEPAPPPEPAPPEPAPPNPTPPPVLPTWDQVSSGHPAGATNPPIPELIATPDGRCFKAWVPGMIAGRRKGDRVEPCAPGDDCGTPIQCPERAAELLERHRSGP